MKVKVTENDIKMMVSESVKRILNESTFFPGNDSEFPKMLASKIKDIADENGVTFEYKGDYVSLSMKFRDELMWYKISEIYGVKMNEDRTLNYWRCLMQPSGACHCYGPGYPDTAVHDQKPITEEEFLTMVEKTIKHLAQYYK